MTPQKQANDMVIRAQRAGAIFEELSQEHTDRIVKAVVEAAFNQRVKLAKMAVKETGMGNWQDKVLKNVIATQLLYELIKDKQTVGVLSRCSLTGIEEIAQPRGPILAVTPVTNPTSTVLFKIILCLKTRNPIIISPHQRAMECCQEAARICYQAALKEDAPEDCIQIIKTFSRDLTSSLMTHPNLALILATGGAGLVKAAYSSGIPAIGVGPGNVPVLVEKTADIPFTVENIIASKTFDNGTICASEQAIVAEKSISTKLKAEFKKQNCYFLNATEIKKLEKTVFNKQSGMINPNIIGQLATKVAKLAGIKVPQNTKILMAPLHKVGLEYPLSGEKLSPILAYYESPDFNHAIKLCIDLNHRGGLGHTAAIYTNDDKKIELFGELMDAGRIVVNTPSSQGAVGGTYNHLVTSLTLGCGAGGKNITAENVSIKHLINIKRLAKRRINSRFHRFDLKKYFNEKNKWDKLLSEYNQNY